MTPLWFLVFQVVASWFAFCFGLYACKIVIQKASFASSLSLVVPASLTLLWIACDKRKENACFLKDYIPYLYWECPVEDSMYEFIFDEYAWIWIVWWLSQIWITRHIFNPKCGRLASTENLFATPFYNSLFIDQSLTMNRRKDETHELKTEDMELETK